MRFEDYYKAEIKKYNGEKNYILAKAKEKRPLLKRIIKYAKNRKILEAGSGTSSNSIFLANNGFQVTSIDKDPQMIKLSIQLSKNFNNSPKFIEKNFENFKGKGFSVVFNHGVLEHFEDKKIISLLKKQLEIGEYLIFSAPSNFFKQHHAINGDERFLSKKKWRSLIMESNSKIKEEFSYYYDPDTFKLKSLKFLSKITKNILPIKKPYIGFVIEKNVCNT
jgi:2-polyprenyl-3-methyl-5-hydroxy-6-metoxy-1,4-benzoquinol methylase